MQHVDRCAVGVSPGTAAPCCYSYGIWDGDYSRNARSSKSPSLHSLRYEVCSGTWCCGGKATERSRLRVAHTASLPRLLSRIESRRFCLPAATTYFFAHWPQPLFCIHQLLRRSANLDLANAHRACAQLLSPRSGSFWEDCAHGIELDSGELACVLALAATKSCDWIRRQTTGACCIASVSALVCWLVCGAPTHGLTALLQQSLFSLLPAGVLSSA